VTMTRRKSEKERGRIARLYARAVFVVVTYTSVRKDTMDARPEYLCVSAFDVRTVCVTNSRGSTLVEWKITRADGIPQIPKTG